MGMAIEDAILCLKGIKQYGSDTFTKRSQGDWQKSLNLAIDTMCKYQQIEQIVKQYKKFGNIDFSMQLISGVVGDGDDIMKEEQKEAFLDNIATKLVNNIPLEMSYDDKNDKECEEHEEIEPEETKGENTMLKEITLSNGKVVRVLKAKGYYDGYYWDMSATVEIDGEEYTIQDAGSGSGYDPIFQSMSKLGPCKLTGVELTPVNFEDDEFNNWDYIFGAIEDIAEDFFANNAKESYEYYDDTYGDCSTHVDGVKVGTDGEEEE